MVRRGIRALGLLLALVLPVGALPAAFAAEEPPRLIVNDSGSTLETRVYEDEVHLPAEAIARLEGVSFEYNAQAYSLMFSRGDNYVSFDLRNHTCLINGRRSKARVYKVNQVYYVPGPETVRALGCNFERVGGDFVRIRDESARLNAGQVLTLLGVQVTPGPTAPPTDPTLGKTVVLCFEGTGGETESLLQRLDELGMKAQFFISAQQIGENPWLVRRMDAVGHGLGILLPDGEYAGAEAVLAQAEYTNELFCRLLKTRVRAVAAWWDGVVQTHALDQPWRVELRKQGYDVLVEAVSAMDQPSEKAVLDAAAEAVSQSAADCVLLLLDNDEPTRDALEALKTWLAEQQCTLRPLLY